MSTSNYAVVVEKFADRHYISKFKKKYQNVWGITWNAIAEELKRIESLIGESSIVEIIADVNGVKICKTEFRIAGPGKSRHASGNRCIIAVRKDTAVVHVLLVYSKGDIGGINETASWKALIRDNYPEFRGILS